jgi:hypothetical protein
MTWCYRERLVCLWRVVRGRVHVTRIHWQRIGFLLLSLGANNHTFYIWFVTMMMVGCVLARNHLSVSALGGAVRPPQAPDSQGPHPSTRLLRIRIRYELIDTKKRETRRHCVGKTSSKAVRPPRYTTRQPCSCFLCPLSKTPTGSSRRPPGPVPVEASKTARRIDAATILWCRPASPLRWQACSLYSINQERLNGLAILCIEKILLDEIDIDTIDFASKMLEETFKIIMIWIHYLIAY